VAPFSGAGHVPEGHVLSGPSHVTDSKVTFDLLVTLGKQRDHFPELRGDHVRENCVVNTYIWKLLTKMSRGHVPLLTCSRESACNTARAFCTSINHPTALLTRRSTTPHRSRSSSRHTSCRFLFNSTPLPLTIMLSLTTLALAGAIVGTSAFAPATMSAPALRSSAPKICTRDSAVVRSMSGDGTTTLTRPSDGTETFLQNKPEYSSWIREQEWKSGGLAPDSLSHSHLADLPAAARLRTLNEDAFK